jgi:DtxR family Mn-dependent transcriptional regulator
MSAVQVNPADEDYLQTFLELEEDGIRPIGARLAERLGISAAAVSEGMHRLITRGLAAEHDKVIELTETGRQAGRAVIRRHRLAECFLVDILGLRWEQAHREAARWEHVISEDVEQAILTILGDPAVCPHGNPIPGSKRTPPADPLTSLDQSDPGVRRLVRISEQAQAEDAVIVFLGTAGLLPGAIVEVLEKRTPSGVRVRGDRGECVVPASTAALLWVTTH